MTYDSRVRPHQIQPTDGDGAAVATGKPYGLQVAGGGPYGSEVDGLVPVVGGLTSDDSSVILTDNGDGTVDLSASGGGGGSSTYHGAKVYRSAAYTYTNGLVTPTVFPFDAEDWDTNAYHDNATNPSRITIPTGLGGIYLVTFSLQINANTTARFIGYITKNGSAVHGGRTDTVGGNGAPGISSSTQVSVADGDYIEISYLCGAALASLPTACAMSAVRLGSLS